MLKTLVEDQLWTWDEPFTIGGLDIGARMTIVRLSDSGLWIHSPLTPEEPLQRTINQLGLVRFIIVPNTAHYLGASTFAEAYPEAKVFAAPNMAGSPKV